MFFLKSKTALTLILILSSLYSIALAASRTQDSKSMRISGETKYSPHTLVRLKAENVPAKSAIKWRVLPSLGVQRATTPKEILEFAAKPGKYEVELLAISINGEAIELQEATTAVEIEGCHPMPPAPPSPPTPPNPKPPSPGTRDTLNAIGKIQFGNAGCTATVIWPQRSDGRWDLLTAAHCVQSVGQVGKFQLRNGREFQVKVVDVQRGPDCAWLVTTKPEDALPYAVLAKSNPPTGVAVWHAGFGIDKPGNREDGIVTSGESSQGQISFTLSVSSGDSGGGIVRTDTDEIVSTVCCTQQRGVKTTMYGASTLRINQHRIGVEAILGNWWNPIDLPIVWTPNVGVQKEPSKFPMEKR